MQEKAQVVLGIINQVSGNRIRFDPDFDRTPAIVFNPGESVKAVNLAGITKNLAKTTTIKIRINNLSEGDNFLAPSEVSVKLVTKNIRNNSTTRQVIMPATSTTDYSALESLIKGMSSEISKISSRITRLEGMGQQDASRDTQALEIMQEMDAETAKTSMLIEQILTKLGLVGQVPVTPTPAPTVSPIDATMAAAISQVVREVLAGLGVTTTTPVSTSGVLTLPDGKKVNVVVPPKPTCPPIVTATTVSTPVEPELEIVWKACPVNPNPNPCGSCPGTTNPCGTHNMPTLVSLENGWRNTVDVQPFPNSYDRVAYYRDGSRIFLQGNVTGASDQLESSNKTKAIFRIPASCAPKTQQSFAVSGRTSNGGIEAVELIIYPNPDGSAIVYAQNEGIIPQTIAIVGSYLLA